MKKFLLSLLFSVTLFSNAFAESGWVGDHASDIKTDTLYFNNNLSVLDDNVQKALETLNKLIASGGGMVYPGAGISLSTGAAWGTSITNNSANWNTAYGWGNHASAGYEVTSNKVTSISGSSTNTQYPSAKLLYDQLATKLATGDTAANSSLLENHNAAYFQVAGSYQAAHANLTSLAGLPYVSAAFVKMTNANTFTLDTSTYLTAESDPLSATKALNNLNAVAINTSLISDTANTDDLGTEALFWKKLYLASDISFEGATDDTYQTTLTTVDPTLSDKSINIPNASGTMAVSATAPATLSATGDIGVTVLKDIVTTAPLTGAANDVLPGADSDLTLALDFTAAWDFGGTSSLEIPNGTSGTTDATGEIYLDTNGDGGTNFSGEALQIYTGATNKYLFPMALPLAASQDNYVPTYDASTKTISWEAGAGGGTADAFTIINTGGILSTASRIELNELLGFIKTDEHAVSAYHAIINGFVDVFSDETGVDTATSANESFTTGYYQPSSGESLYADSNQTSSYTTFGDGADTEYRVAQSFTLSSTQTITSCQIYASAKANTPTQTVTARIETDNSNVPSGTLADANLTKQITTFDAPAWNAFAFATPASLAAGQYWIVLDIADQTTDKKYTIGGGSDTYANNAYSSKYDGAWHTNASIDIGFKLYTNLYNNMSLYSNAYTATTANPNTALLMLQEEDVDAITINTDLKAWFSEDNGSTFTQVTLTDYGDVSGKQIWAGTADVSAQAGSSVKWQVTTLNNKNLKLHGIAGSYQ